MGSIRVSLRCMRCRYELLGQPVAGRCPECGLAVVASLAMRTDHLQHGEAALRRPGLVSAALVGGAMALLLSVALQVAGPMLSVVDTLRGQTSLLQGQVRLWGWIGSLLVVTIAGALAARATSAAEGGLRDELGRWRTWLLTGFVGWAAALAVAMVLQWNVVHLPDALRSSMPWIGVAIQLPGLTSALAGLNALLAITGRRSQSFAEAHAARQSVSLLNSTAALVVVFAIAVPMLHRLEFDVLAVTAMCVTGGLAALLLFGSAYLVANAWWVARALVLPKPHIEEVIEPG